MRTAALLFAILQKYDFSSKSQPTESGSYRNYGCLRYCKSTIFQANHNSFMRCPLMPFVVCDTAKVRFFKQITTHPLSFRFARKLFAILQKYDFSSKSQQYNSNEELVERCLRYCKSTIFQANHNMWSWRMTRTRLFAILQKYDFSSKSQPNIMHLSMIVSCLRYCKSTIFQANHNWKKFLKLLHRLFAILQKYDFSSKSQPNIGRAHYKACCLRYCKSTIFQANHNTWDVAKASSTVVCDTAKVRFFKQITTHSCQHRQKARCLRYCKSTIFQANHNTLWNIRGKILVVCDTAKVRFFKQITTWHVVDTYWSRLDF